LSDAAILDGMLLVAGSNLINRVTVTNGDVTDLNSVDARRARVSASFSASPRRVVCGAL